MAEKLSERDENIVCGVIVGSHLDNADKTRLCDLVRGLNAADEETALHKFTPMSSGDGNGEAGSADEEIWCADCEYHRDHAIHQPAALSGVEALIAAKRELSLVREAAHDLSLSDGAVRAVASGLTPPTADDIAWAATALKGSK